MPTPPELQAAERRLAQMINARADSEERERRADASARAERIRVDDLRCKDLMAEFQPDYARHGCEPPMARSDEWSNQYEVRLLKGLQRRLSPDSDPKRVLRICDPRTRTVLWGRPFDRMPG
jgi:hypothetical protein